VRAVLARLKARCELEWAPQAVERMELAGWLEALAGELRALRPQAVVEVHAPNTTCHLAEGAMRRLLRNLMLNAIDAGGRVSCVAERNGEQLVLCISDDAGGMARQDLRHCLTSGISGRGSTGLGTVSVEECARILKASLRVRAREPHGTEFEIAVPLDPELEPRAGAMLEMRAR
jgi:signal transduction histidine kinase